MDNNTTSDFTIKKIIEKYGLLNNKVRAKSFGQHFLCDVSLLRKIAKMGMCYKNPYEEFDVIEIGPGPGGLTQAILFEFPENVKVFAIEKDNSLKILHDDLFFNEKRLRFIYADALKIRLKDITNRDCIIISNLPYNVSTKLLMNWLSFDFNQIKGMILMFQKEVAERIVAKVKTKDYGRLSVISQLLCDCEKLFDVSEKAFYPSPKVMSSIVKLTPRSNIRGIDISKVDKVVSLSFQKRRKTMLSILKNYVKNNEFEKCEIDKMTRPEAVSPSQFLCLANLLDL